MRLLLAKILYAVDVEIGGVSHAELLRIPAHWELGALELGGPGVVKLPHDVLAVVSGGHTQRPVKGGIGERDVELGNQVLIKT